MVIVWKLLWEYETFRKLWQMQIWHWVCYLCCTTKSGVLPVLFLIYITDIAKCHDCTKWVMYAGDTIINVASKTISDLYVRGNLAVSLYNEWFTSIRLTVNKNKTLYLIFHRKQKKSYLLTQSPLNWTM